MPTVRRWLLVDPCEQASRANVLAPVCSATPISPRVPSLTTLMDMGRPRPEVSEHVTRVWVHVPEVSVSWKVMLIGDGGVQLGGKFPVTATTTA